MIDRPVEVMNAAAPGTAGGDGRRRAAMSARDVAILRSLADRIDPSDPGAHNNLGVVFFQKGLVEDAVAAFERALELDPRLEVARTNIQIAYARSGLYRRRVAELLDRVAGHPADAEARDALARTYLLGGDPEGAAREWRSLLGAGAENLPLLMKLAYAEAECGRHAEAERFLARALELAPDEGAVHLQRAELHQRQGDLTGAAISARRAAVLAPDHARAHALLADLLEGLGRDREAAAARERAEALDPAVLEGERHLSLERYFSITAARAEREPAPVEGPLEHYAAAVERRRHGDLAGALRGLERALADGEDEVEVRQAMAELKLIDGDLSGAAADYATLLEARPDSPKLWNEWGVALHRGGQADEALGAYRRAVATDHAYLLGWNNVGVALAQAGDAGGAERAFHKATEGDPPAEVLWNLALFLGRHGRPEEAADACRAALEAGPDLPESWARLGGALFQAGQATEARDALLHALDLDPDHAEARYQLGFTLSALGDFPGALRETKRALELDPLFPAPAFRLLIDVQFEAGSLPAPEVEGRLVRPGSPVETFQPDEGALDQAFSGLTLPPRGRPAAFDDAIERARTALRKGQAARAAELAGRALAMAPDAVDPLLLQANAQLALGLAGEALERFDAVLRTGLGEVAHAARLGRARCLLLLDRPREAAESAARASGPDAVALRGKALLAAGDADGAVRAFEAAATASRDAPSAPVLAGLGEALLAAGRPADAEPVLRAALELDPAGVAARVGLGRALAALGIREAAEAEYEAAVEALPSYGEAVLRLADLRWRSHRRRAAVGGLVEFLQLDPTHAAGLVRLGTWLNDLGRPGQATTALRRALRFDPGNVAARAELDRMAGEGVG
ncbi:MAG TPA: tetratricopeptide repeat protein [Longimicrobiales bacterium]|nr:tetratricopeptide repeat protein [Longimicrobiales bacterium]